MTSRTQTLHNPIGRYSKWQMCRIFQPGAHSIYSTNTGFVMATMSNARTPETTTTGSLPSGDHILPGEIER